MNIAIFSPNQNPYSETFIQAHKKYLKGNVYYYYGTGQGVKIEGQGNLVGSYKQYFLRLQKKIFNKPNHFIWTESILTSLKKNNIDSVLIEYGTHAYHLLPLLERLRIPIVTHFHGYDASIRYIVDKCNKYHRVFKVSSKVIAVSLKMKEMLIELGCPRVKIVHTPCGPNGDFFKINPRYNKKQFVSIGRFVDKKAPYLTILAFSAVVKKHPDVKLLMAGEGTLLNTCKNLVKQYKLEKNVKFLGVLNPEEVRDLFKNSIAYVQHSITADSGDMEGTPVSILEASASGLPVISTVHAGIPDVIIHNKTGLLCEEHDIDTMSKNMIKLIEKDELTKEMGAEGKRYIRQNFNMNRHINLIQLALEA